MSEIFDIILCLVGAVVVLLTCFAPYHYREYDDSPIMEIFMGNNLLPIKGAQDIKNKFKEYYNNKLLLLSPHNDYNNKTYLYIFFIEFLKWFFKKMPIIGKIKIKTPFILQKTLRNPRLEVKEFGFLLIYTVIGASLLISANNLVSLYLSLELQSFTLYILASSQIKSFKGTSGGLKYFLLGGLSSGFILLGCSLIYAYTGTLNIQEIFYIYSDTNINYILDPCLFILFGGLLFKVSAAPFHNWAPDVYSDVPTYTTTWLIVIAKLSTMIFMLLLIHNIQSSLNINSLNYLEQYYNNNHEIINKINNNDTFNSQFNDSNLKELNSNNKLDILKSLMINNSYIIDRLYYGINSFVENYMISEFADFPFSFVYSTYSSLGLWSNILTVSALLSLIIGTFVGLSQSRIKRLFAYSTIAHVGFLLLALSLNSVSGIDAFIFYLIQYTITNLNLFFILIAWGYIYSRYYLEKEFIPIRYLPVNPLLLEDKYILPSIYDYGNYMKKRLIEEKSYMDNPYPHNVKVYTVNKGLMFIYDDNYYDFDIEDTEWLYTPVPFLTNFKGMHSRDPFLAFCLSITLLSLAGIPPMIGFFAKQQVLLAALQSDYYFVSIIAILVSIISAAYYIRIIRFIYFYDESFMPYYLSNSNLYNIKLLELIPELFHKDFLISHNKAVFIDNDNINDKPLPMLPNNNLSLLIAIFTNFSLFFIFKPYLLINIIMTMTLPLYIT
jgi:NADH:ubiquinone oxidoreductase subunit 2 (subunit N)